MGKDSSFWSFDRDGREFVIRRPALPDHWRNQLATDDFNAVFDQTGGGMTFGRSAEHDRVTADNSPRAVFLRDAESGRFWLLNGTGAEGPAADWECRHGMGSTRLSCTVEGLAASVTYFLPVRGSVEIWRIRVHNTTDRPRKLGVFTQIIWRLAYVRTPAQNYNVVFRRGAILAESYFWNGPAVRSSLPEFNRTWDRVAFMAGSAPPAGFDCLPEQFIGDGSSAAPQAVREGRCGGSFGRGGENIGALQHALDLAPGGSADLVIVVGYAPDAAGARRLIRRYASVAAADAAWTELEAWWDDYLGRMTVQTPDREVNDFINGWNQRGIYQRYYIRYGLRDTAQDTTGLSVIDRPRARRRLEGIVGAQFKDGNYLHDVPFFRFPSHRTVNSDPPLWLPWAVAAYLKETGDWAFLGERRPFTDGGSATVYDHAARAIDWVLSQSGRHGLPLIKCGDWNDALAGAYRKGVSVWMAEFLYINLQEMVQIAQRHKRPRDAERFAREARRIQRAVNEHCWDGRWYLRGFDSDGKPIGSKSCREGRIFSNPQSWAVMGGLAPADRALTSLKSIERLMDTPVGIPMMFPAYSKPNPALGEITRFAPYHHHNGGVWNHLNPWVMLAECKVGRPDRALDIFHRIFPPRLAREVERFTAPPYAYGSWTNTPRSRLYGKADLGCNTGTTVWAARVLAEGFCGVTPEHDGLRIDPRLPAAWPRALLKRPYRNAVFHIQIENPDRLPVGRPVVELDGRELPGNLLPASLRGEHEVRVRLARK